MRRKKQESGIEYDEKLLQHIAPIGNMTPYNSYCRTGTGYEACVHIFSLPTMLDDFWMTDICNFQNSVAIYYEKRVICGRSGCDAGAFR